MKEFFEIMMKDIYSEHFTRREMVIYGIFAPLIFTAVCIFASWVDTL